MWLMVWKVSDHSQLVLWLSGLSWSTEHPGVEHMMEQSCSPHGGWGSRERKRRKQAPNISFKGMLHVTWLCPTMLHLLNVPPYLSSITGWRPMDVQDPKCSNGYFVLKCLLTLELEFMEKSNWYPKSITQSFVHNLCPMVLYSIKLIPSLIIIAASYLLI